VTDGGTTTITSAGSSATMFQVVGTLTTSISGAGAITMTSLLPTSNSAAVTIFGGRDVVAGSVQIRPQNVFDQNNGSNINLRLNPTFAYGTGGSTNVGSNLKLDYTINNTGGTLSTIRGIWIKPTETSLTNTTHYSIVSETTTGKGGVATAAPTDYWTIGAGTSTIAPFGLTSGTDLSSPANGKMEYDGINLKFTPASTTRKVVSLYQVGRSTAQTAANASVVTWTVGANDGTFLVSANVIPTTSTLHNFTVTCSYTDETNTARVVTLNFSQLAGTFVTAIANAAGAVPYEGIPLQIRCKAGTTITIGSTGTFTTVTYNIEGSIAQIN